MQSVHGLMGDISGMFLAPVFDLVFCILGASYVHFPKFPWQSVSVPLLVITLVCLNMQSNFCSLPNYTGA